MAAADPKLQVLLVTGMSGAGKTSVLKGLEDMGFEAIDNLPLSLLASLVLPHQPRFAAREIVRPLAIGVDIRTRDFDVVPFLDSLAELRGQENLDVKLLFLDCSDVALERRYGDTRRRHPLARAATPTKESLAEGIRTERSTLGGLMARADIVIDTSAMTLGALKRELLRHFALELRTEMALFVTSFSYRRGVPRESDLVLDVSFLPAGRSDGHLAGTPPDAPEAVAGGTEFAPFFKRLTEFLEPLLPRYAAEGKSYLTVALGDTDGRVGAPAAAERLAARLEGIGWRVHVQHRDRDPASTP